MKRATKFISILLLLLLVSNTGKGQSLRYFEFKTRCFTNGNNTWEDSSFIAATSDTILIDSIYADLARPDSMRQMIIGPVDSGNGGYNHNASHWFLWHFVENQWTLTQAAIELCDGCPTGVDTCIACFIQIHAFCPWSSYVAGEITVSAIDEISFMDNYYVYPNPARDKLEIKINKNDLSEIIIFDIVSRKLIQQQFKSQDIVNIEQLTNGIYIYEVRNKDNTFLIGKFIKQ